MISVFISSTRGVCLCLCRRARGTHEYLSPPTSPPSSVPRLRSSAVSNSHFDAAAPSHAHTQAYINTHRHTCTQAAIHTHTHTNSHMIRPRRPKRLKGRNKWRRENKPEEKTDQDSKNWEEFRAKQREHFGLLGCCCPVSTGLRGIWRKVRITCFYSG